MISINSRADRRRNAHAALPHLLLLFAGFLLAFWPAPANATAFGVNKDLCQGTTCGLQSVAPGAAVYYKISLNAPPTSAATPVDILDTLPVGFQPVAYGCAASAGAQTATTPSTAQSLVISTSVPVTGVWECVISGFFVPGPPQNVSNTAQVVDPANHASVWGSDSVNTYVDPALPLPSNLAVNKTANVTSIDISQAPQDVTYTITITNTGAVDLYLGSLMTLDDSLKLPPLGVVVNASLINVTCAATPGSDCLNPVSTITQMPVLIASGAPTAFAHWGYPTGSQGVLHAGHQIVLTVVVRYSRVPGVVCILAPNADGAINHADIVLTLPGTQTTLSDINAGDNFWDVPVHIDTGATVVDPACNAPYQPPSPVLQVTKVQVSPLPNTAPHPWGTTFRYRVTVRNISQIPGLRIRNIQVADSVVEWLQTPPFTGTRMGYSCTPSCTTPSPILPQQFQGNFDTRQMAAGGILVAQSAGGLAYNQTASFDILLRYSNPGCDSYPAINPKDIFNLGRVTAWDQQVGTAPPTHVNQIVQGAVVTHMQPVPACPLITHKTSSSAGVILFGNPNNNATTTYQIDFGNPTNQSYTMGTIGDMMRIVPPLTGVAPYAFQIQVDYSFNCMVTQGTVTGYPGTNQNGPNGFDTVQVVVTQLPQQGVRLIRNNQPVVFGPHSNLHCDLFAWVHQPAAHDPYCSTGFLENASVMDASIYYDPNSPWPSTSAPGMWSSVVRPLPPCHNLVVNKTASPPWIWPGGGPLSWTLHVTNFGPVVTPADRLIVTDTMSNGLLATTYSQSCIPTTGCPPPPPPPPLWNPSPSAANPSILNIGNLRIGAQIQTVMTLANAPASVGPGGQVCNAATASVSQWVLPPHNIYYWKSTQTLHDDACIPVFAAGSLTVRKLLDNNVGAQLPSNFVFPITVNCSSYGPNATLGLAAGGTWTAQHVPAGSTCTIGEGALPVLAPTPTCAHPVWTTNFSPGATVVIPQANNSTTTVTVRNVITCPPPAAGTLVIRKITIAGPAPPNFTAALFNVTCGSSAPVTLSVPANGQTSMNNIAAPSICTIVEQPLPPQAGCTWVGTQTPPGGVAIASGATTTVTYTNRLICPQSDATLLVRKFVFVNGSTTPRSPSTLPASWLPISFPVTITCGSSPPIQSTMNAANNYQTAVAVPLNATCTVNETVPVFPTPNCHWSTSYPQGQTAVIATGTTVRDVYNTQVCP